MRTHPSVASAHAVALLRKLNIQRMEGKFCDCVIRQYLNPGKLYLAHKSVLAASSPVLASLLPSKSVLLELQFPSTTKEVLGSLLEFIYTGILPPADQDDSLLSAATYLQIEELQQALSNSKLDSSSESDCIVAADRKPTVKRKFSDQHQSKRKEPSSFHSTLFPQSCEVVPVICHASKNYSLVSKTQPQSNIFNIGFDLTRNKADISALEVTTGHGLLKQSYVDEEEEALNDTQPEQIRNLSAGSMVSDLPIAAPEDVENYSDELHKELDEKSVFLSSGYVAPTHTVVCSEIQMEDYAENTINEEFAAHISPSSDNDRSPHCPSLSTSKGSEGFSTPHQLDTDDDKHSKCHFTLQSENITGPEECTPDCCKENTHEEKFKDLCSSKVTGAYYAKGDMTKCFRSASRLNLWTEAPSYSTKHPESLEEVTLNEHRREIKGCVANTNEMQVYQGQVCYRYLEREAPRPVQSSDSDDDGLYGAVASSNLREGLDITVQANASDFVLLDISAKRGSAGHPDTDQSRLGTVAPASAQPYQCTTCDRAFSQRGSLNRHMRSHLGVRPYPCPQCPMTFSRQYRVTEHMRVHLRGCEDSQGTDPT